MIIFNNKYLIKLFRQLDQEKNLFSKKGAEGPDKVIKGPLEDGKEERRMDLSQENMHILYVKKSD